MSNIYALVKVDDSEKEYSKNTNSICFVQILCQPCCAIIIDDILLIKLMLNLLLTSFDNYGIKIS